jgi:hypothetical protein
MGVPSYFPLVLSLHVKVTNQFWLDLLFLPPLSLSGLLSSLVFKLWGVMYQPQHPCAKKEKKKKKKKEEKKKKKIEGKRRKNAQWFNFCVFSCLITVVLIFLL